MKRRTKFVLVAAAGTAALAIRRLGKRHPIPDPHLLTAAEVRSLYDQLAPIYDMLASGYQFVGGGNFRRRAVGRLDLGPGDTVLELACGTGANFTHLHDAVGPTGRIVGIDLSPGMLAEARKRAKQHGWTNVELVEGDLREVLFPERVEGIISTFGLEMIPEHDAVIERAIARLIPDGKIVVGGLRRPEEWPNWLIRIGEWINRPFGVSRAYEDVQPWRSVLRHANDVEYEEHLFGAAYLTTGAAPAGNVAIDQTAT